MQIVLNTMAIIRVGHEEYNEFIYESLRRIYGAHPEHHFIFLTDHQNKDRFEWGGNTRTIVVKLPSKNLLACKWWYDVRLPLLLKKTRADLFISIDVFCSLRTKLPQIIVPGNLTFYYNPSRLRKTQQLFYKRFVPAFIRSAKSVVVFSEYAKNELIRIYHPAPEKIDLVCGTANKIFQKVDLAIRERTKQKYADGKEFFLYSGPVGQEATLTNLLKAFSLFKRRQQSNIKLLITGRSSSGYDLFSKSLETYKYRSDVIVIADADEASRALIVSSAFALVYPALRDMNGLPIMEAMQCAVPVITSSTSASREIGGDAALLSDSTRPKDIAEQMMRLYKDEKLWNELILKSKERSLHFSASQTDELLWRSIQKAVTPP